MYQLIRISRGRDHWEDLRIEEQDQLSRGRRKRESESEREQEKMVHLLAELLKPNCINHSVYAHIYHENSASLVLNKINRLEFFRINYNGQQFPQHNSGLLVLVDSLTMDEPVLAMEKLAHPNLSTDCLVLLTETFKLIVLWYDPQLRRFTVVHSVSFNASDQQLPSDSLPKIEVDPSGSFFLVYFFEGFVQAFILNQKWVYQDPETSEKRSKRKLDQLEFADVVTFSVGSIIVQDIRILRYPNTNYYQSNSQVTNTILIYYRDFNFNLSMRYYYLDCKHKKFNLVNQFEEFDEIPSAIINPLSGGSLVVTDNYIFYFPNPDITYLELSDDNQDQNISIDSQSSVITKRLITQNSHDISAFNTFTIIDSKRIILINNRGETYILFFDSLKKTSNSIQVNSISFIRLGMTTVPIGIHHINDNIFYVASKLSQSVLFKILPKDPFIDIIEFITSSPPILDIKANYNGHRFELLTCQGGYESGEFRRVSNRMYYLEFKHSLKSATTNSKIWQDCYDKHQNLGIICFKDPDNNKLQRIRIGLNMSTENLETYHSSTCILSKASNKHGTLSVQQDGVMLNGESLNRFQILKTAAIDVTKFSVLTSSNEVIIYAPDFLHKLNLDTDIEVSDMDIIEVHAHEVLVLLAFWDGSYRVYDVSVDECVMLCQENLMPNEVSISSCCFMYYPDCDPNGVWLLLSNFNGELVQIFYDFKRNEKSANRSSVTKFDGLPYKFIRSNDSQNVIMFNKNNVYGIFNECLMNFNKIFPLDLLEPKNMEINDATFLGDNRLVLSANVDDVLIYSINPNDTTKDVIFSNDFYIKSLRLNKKSTHVIVLGSKNAFVDSSNEYCRNSFLQLVDLNKMKPVYKLEFPESNPVEILDICPVPVSDLNPLPNCFVGISNSSSPLEILRLFQVRNGKIIALDTIKLVGFADMSKVVVQSIRPLDDYGLSFLILGVVNFVVRPNSTMTEWTLLLETVLPSPIFTNSLAIVNEDMVVFGDVMKGLSFVKMFRDARDNIAFVRSAVILYIDTNFLTDLITFESSEGTIVLSSDSFGNLVGLKKQSEESNLDGFDFNLRESLDVLAEVISFNIGDLINTLTIIPKIDGKMDFNSNFDKLDNPIPLTEGRVIFGTVNGGIYSLSELQDLDEEVETILNDCNKEIILFRHTLFDLQTSASSSNKRDKLDRWMSKRDRKFLQQDDTGQYVRRQQQGVIELILIQYWLQRDAQLRRSKNPTTETQLELKEMTKSLKTCYLHKNLLQKLVFDLQYV